MKKCFYLFLFFSLFAGLSMGVKAEVKMKLADGFDFPVGKPDAKKYYKARGVRLTHPVHFGEDWNGRGGGDTDLGDPIYSTADGVVMFAYQLHGGWGRCILVRHAYRDPKTKKVKFIDSLYAHLRRMLVKKGDFVKRGQKIGKLGGNSGMYPAHLHFEMRHNLHIGMQRNSVARNFKNWANPTKFIRAHRHLKVEKKKYKVPTGTYKPYKGFKGL